VEASFDEHWDADQLGKRENDTNAYSTGVIGTHNVVLVHMPGMGKTDATLATVNLVSSFKNVQLALVVGICGGVPRDGAADIMLGDVIISKEIVPYDFGRQFPDQFVRKASLGKPNPMIRSLLAKLEGRMARQKLQASTYAHLVPLVDKLGGSSRYPGVADDKLYQPHYRHKHQNETDCVLCASCHGSSDPICDAALTATCDSLKCDENYLVRRNRSTLPKGAVEAPSGWAEGSEPHIRFGLMASGDTVMKSGEQRDNVAKREGIIAFEMEAAGVSSVYQSNCVVIKAVCDYADSHKNKKWQDYAAAAAAACAKAFLQHWNTAPSPLS
jgi:nucleoside phosphorylase